MNKIFNCFLPSLKTENYYLKRKTEYTLIFLALLLPYIIISATIKSLTLGINNIEFLINLFITVSIGFIYLIFRKGYITTAINLITVLGFVKAIELLVNYQNMQFFVHLFLVIIIGAAVHTRKYQLKTIYILTIILFALKTALSIGYQQKGLISADALIQIYHSVVTGVFFILTINYITKIIEREIRLSSDLDSIANTDMLTGAFNRRKFSKALLYKSGNSVNAFCMIDIDYFKSVNDKLGHEAGDHVLRELSFLIRETLREEDLFYRWGGEEFLMIIPCTSITQAEITVDRIRETVMRHKFYNNISITLSAGIALQEENDDFMTPVRNADIALYRAKKEGRNRVESF